MQIVRYKNPNLSQTQRYTIERIIELCNQRSIDSYRVKYLNPKLALSELYQVIENWNNNRIKQFKTTVLSCIYEVKSLIEKDNYLIYGSTSKTTFISILDAIKAEEDKKEIAKLVFTTNYLIAINNNYYKNLISVLTQIVNENPTSDKEKIILFERIDTLLNYFISELIHIGFTKSYLIKLTRAILVFKSSGNFGNCWNDFVAALEYNQKSNFIIVFALQNTSNQLDNLQEPSLLNEVPPQYLDTPISNTTKNFIKPNKQKKFILYEIEALDTYQSLKLAKNELANILDIIHLGYSNLTLSLIDRALVINRETPDKADTLSVYYQIDGYYKSNPISYNRFISQLKQIVINERISNEVKEKLQSAIRYLRLGNEAIEIEQKFINYWIGLEFIFADYDINANTFARIKEYLVLTHVTTYAKRNLLQLHQAIKVFGLNSCIANFDEDLKYFIDVNTFNELYKHSDNYPLLAFRANRLKSHFHNNSEKREKYLKQHMINLERHLIRIYRIRNELVHEAAQVNNIESITGNLRYYLTFMLNSLIDYFSNINYSNNIKKLMTINDFFHHQEMIWTNIESKKYELEELLKVPYNPEYLS